MKKIIIVDEKIVVQKYEIKQKETADSVFTEASLNLDGSVEISIFLTDEQAELLSVALGAK